ncbi:MAG: PQQ-binding-like beta-propeller repeat protein [Bacteroidota bacterium]
MVRIVILCLTVNLITGSLPLDAFCQDNLITTDWPQWRGPDRSGTWYNGPQVDSLTPGIIHKIWEVPIGSGYSGPTVADGRVYVMDYWNGNERILCLDANDGKPLWSHAYPLDYNVGYPTGPRASVLISGDRAYAWGTMGQLHCLDAATGNVVWSVNTMEQFQSRIPTWGMASNPILVNGLLVVQVGGLNGACMVAFHSETGKEAWRALDDEASYAAPVLIRQAGRQVLVCWTGESITGLNPGTGEVYWSVPFHPLQMIMNVADPVYDPPYLFLSAFFDGSYLLELGEEKPTARLLYHRHGKSETETEALHSTISTPLVRNGYVYGIGSYGETRCLNLLTGERIWENLTLVPRGRWANVHLVSQRDQVWGFNETGELLLGTFRPEGYRDLGRVRIIDPVKISPNPRNGVTWAHPALSGNRVYIRSDNRIVCIEIKDQFPRP